MILIPIIDIFVLCGFILFGLIGSLFRCFGIEEVYQAVRKKQLCHGFPPGWLGVARWPLGVQPCTVPENK